MKIYGEMVEKGGKLKLIPMGQIMLKSGYSENTAKTPQKLTDTDTWEEFIASLDETPIVKKWIKWAQRKGDEKDEKTGKRKKVEYRVALQAGENIMKLKGRFKEQIDIGLKQKREDIIEP